MLKYLNLKLIQKENHSNSDSWIEQYNLQYSRVLCLAAMILYPAVGVVLTFNDPTSIDYMSHRLIMSFLLFLIFCTSFFVKYVNDNILLLVTSLLSLCIVWSIWISAKNNFNANYSIAVISGVIATAICHFSKRSMIIFMVLSCLSLYITMGHFSTSAIQPNVVVIFSFIMAFVLYISYYFKEKMHNEIYRLNNELTINNLELEVKVNNRTKLLERKNTELENFAYIVSHDLKSPLRNIASFTKLMQIKINKGQYESIESYSNMVNKGVVRMSHIIEDLLAYGQIGQSQHLFENVELRPIIDSIIQSNFSSQLDSNVTIEVAPNMPQYVYCDKKQISLLFQNLLSNSVKYNQSENKKIEIGSIPGEDSDLFFVKDNGIGISNDYQKQVFEMFQRLHSDDEYDGTGIGLAICKRIVDNHDGEIGFTSNKDQGTTFHFTISKALAKKSIVKSRNLEIVST